jgi:hypothetical protein
MVPMKNAAREAKRARACAEGHSTKRPAECQGLGCATVSVYELRPVLGLE